MGCHKNVDYRIFPKQGNFLGKDLAVCFNYNTNETLKGKCIRDDIEEPFRTIISLDDGRVIEDCECQYTII